MPILSRIQEIRAVEHQKLRLILARVDSRLRDLEAEARNWSPPAQPTDMFGDPIAYIEVPQTRVIIVQPLIRVWRPFEDQILTRLDRWEEELWPLVRRWADGEPVGHRVQQIARDLLALRERAESQLREVRRQALFVQEMSATMLMMYSALDLCDRAEQEVLPALLSGSRETADRTERSVTADDVARNLRMSFMSEEGSLEEYDEDDLEPSSIWSRLWGRLMGR